MTYDDGRYKWRFGIGDRVIFTEDGSRATVVKRFADEIAPSYAIRDDDHGRDTRWVTSSQLKPEETPVFDIPEKVNSVSAWIGGVRYSAIAKEGDGRVWVAVPGSVEAKLVPRATLSFAPPGEWVVGRRYVAASFPDNGRTYEVRFVDSDDGSALVRVHADERDPAAARYPVGVNKDTRSKFKEVDE